MSFLVITLNSNNKITYTILPNINPIIQPMIVLGINSHINARMMFAINILKILLYGSFIWVFLMTINNIIIIRIAVVIVVPIAAPKIPIF